jgi:methionyl-tRNA formyltransferase
MAALRILFMGTPDFAVPTLVALHGTGHDLVGVCCQPPRPAGRGKQPRPAPVQVAAERLALTVETPVSLKDRAAQTAITALRPDIIVVVAYGLILPQVVLDIPRLGAVNLHASLLPRWRGAAPIQRAIMAGDRETGATIMMMEAGLDTGPILLQEVLAIGPDETAGELHDRLAVAGAELMVSALDGLAAGELEPRPQPAEGVTYAEKINKAEARLDFSAPAIELKRRIQGLNSVPGAWFEIDGERVKVHAAVAVDSPEAKPGTVLDDHLTLACGAGALRLTSVQRQGKGVTTAAEFLHGFPLSPGRQIDASG